MDVRLAEVIESPNYNAKQQGVYSIPSGFFCISRALGSLEKVVKKLLVRKTDCIDSLNLMFYCKPNVSSKL